MYSEKSIEENSYDDQLENDYKRKRYENLFEEFTWIKEDSQKEGSDIFLSFKFLDALLSKDYSEYLSLFIGVDEKFRFRYVEFCDLCDRLDGLVDQSIFDRKTLSDALFYSLVLSKISKSSEYKQLAWVYEVESLSEMLVMHADSLPTMKKFSVDQQKLVRLILDGLGFEGYLEMYRTNLVYDIGDDCQLLKENIECFDLSFLMFICRMAGNYARFGRKTPDLTSGYFSYLSGFEKDLFTHLQQSS
ncbi:MAG: hypothetical protein S4CHLAM20_02350 [Chlamydiia bacterium]|nr:hypothetical protein [Chlamydiia bacterium]